MADTRTGGHDIVKREPLSPAPAGTGDTGPAHTRHRHEAYSTSPSAQNGHHVGNGSGSDSGGDAPLDFSIKRRARTSDSDGEADSHRYSRAVKESPDSDLDKGTNSERNGEALLSEAYRKAANGVSKRREDSRIGEPPTALPGCLPGAVGAAMPGLAGGLVPHAGMFPLIMDPRHLQHTQQSSANGSHKSSARPFKAYPKDPLSLPLGYYGIPGMLPFPTLDSVTAQAVNSEDLFNQYRLFVLKAQEQSRASAGAGKGQSQVPSLAIAQAMAAQQASSMSPSAKSTTSETSSTTARSTSSSPTLSTTCTTPVPTSPTSPNGADPATPTPSAAPAAPTSTQTPSRKRGRILPDEQKDQAYWERRRKNNEAAKRSRDARRAKEDEIAIRAAFLEQENLKLRVEVAALKNETAKLRCMLYNS